MQKLEKILNELEQATKQEDAPIYCGDMEVDGYVRMSVVEDIIRKHMKDGWIPVEDWLPDNNEDVLVTTDVGLITFGYVSHGKWITDQEPDYPIAWRPLPEPYRPERSDNNDGE